MLDEDIINLFIKEYPDHASELSSAIELLNDVFNSIYLEIEENIAEYISDNNYTAAGKYMEMHSKIKSIIEENEINIEVLETIVEDDLIDYKEHLNNEYVRFELDDNRPYGLENDFSYKKPVAIRIEDEKIKTNDWKEVLLETSKYLYDKDPELFKTFPLKEDMNGRTRLHYSFDKNKLRNPILIPGSRINIEGNKSANGIKKSIIKMLDAYRIEHNKFSIYLDSDYSAKKRNRSKGKR